MSFVRVKKAKKKQGEIVEYAYIVENRRVWGKVKQRSKKYLGRVFRFGEVNVAEFYEFHGIDPSETDLYLDNKSVKDILLDLISLELYRHGFSKVENRKRLWCNGDVFVDLRDNKFYTSKGQVALGFNEGFLCNHYVSKLLNFRVSTEDDAMLLAKTFVEAGIEIPKEIFVGVFSKLSKGKELFEFDD